MQGSITALLRALDILFYRKLRKAERKSQLNRTPGDMK